MTDAHPHSSTASAARALVLAGRRAGGDPVCEATGVAHKALLRFEGVPCLVRVFRALEEAGVQRPVHVSVADPGLLDGSPETAALRDAGALRPTPASVSPAASVRDFLAGAESEGPWLVTSSDHALLDAGMVRHVLEEAPRLADGRAELVVGVVEAGVFRARFPDAPRTFIRLRPEPVSGANLFWFRSREALAAADFWTRAEALRKQPWRLAALFGPMALLRFALGRLPLAEAFERASRAIGVRVAPLPLPYAEAAIDVDRPADVEVVQGVLSAR